VEAPGIENDKRPTADTIEHERGSIGVRAVSANVPDRASKCAIDRRDVTESSEAYELSNVVETALARALVWRRRRSGGTWWCRSPKSFNGEGQIGRACCHRCGSSVHRSHKVRVQRLFTDELLGASEFLFVMAYEWGDRCKQFTARLQSERH